MLSNKDWLLPTERDVIAPFFEALWDITPDLRLTVGGRYDSYSDLRDVFSHSAGLTWEFIPGYNARLFYARSFRAPVGWEQYWFARGNANLDFVKYTTWMTGLDAQFTPYLSGRVNFTAYYITDPIEIDSQSGIFINVNDRFKTKAIEAELKYDFGRGTYLSMCYSGIRPEEPQLYTPDHSGTLMANIRLSRHLNLNADLYYAGGFKRASSDVGRDDPSDYGIVNATLIARKFWKRFEGLELRGSVYNLFDKDYVYPRPRMGVWAHPDFPAPGRSFLFEIQYKF